MESLYEEIGDKKIWMSSPSKGSLSWDFFSPVFCSDQTFKGQRMSLLSSFEFNFEFSYILKKYGDDSVDMKSHSLSTESTPNVIPCWLFQCGVKPHVNWVNMEWWIFINICASNVSVDIGSKWLLPQSTWDLTQYWTIDAESHLWVNPVCLRWTKPMQAYITISGAIKGKI